MRAREGKKRSRSAPVGLLDEAEDAADLRQGEAMSASRRNESHRPRKGLRRVAGERARTYEDTDAGQAEDKEQGPHVGDRSF